MHGWNPGISWGAMICGGSLLLLLLAALIAVVVLLFAQNRAGQRPAASPPAAQTPLEILKERYAQGEITHEEFQEMREHLRE